MSYFLPWLTSGDIMRPEGPRAKQGDGFMPVHHAAMLGHLPVVEYLKQAGADLDTYTTEVCAAAGGPGG